jgi:peptidyl-prolyl cis-trans isomerase SurA
MIFNHKVFSKEKFFIIYNVNDKIITNTDVKKEAKYLISLNSQLKNLDEEDIFDISKESILKENIKKIELLKYINLDLNTKNLVIDEYVKNFYLRLKLNNIIEFEEYLKSNGLNINYLKKKILIEISWNELIYNRYKNQIKVDEKKLMQEIKSNKNTINEKVYFLSEIVFEKNNQENLDIKIENIKKSIEEIGFKNSANIYSVSNSAKFGGEVGWIEEKQLSNIILKKLSNLDVGQYSKPIQLANTFTILKINEIKFKKKIIDYDQELKNKIEFETNKQLEQFSKIYYNKIKINTNINEL